MSSSSFPTSPSNRVDPALPLSELFRQYWQNECPFHLLASWLSRHGPLLHRDFSFRSIHKPDLVHRFEHFESGDALQSYALQTIPTRIDIGGIYNSPPMSEWKREQEQQQGGPVGGGLPPLFIVARELVFDVDVSDYFPLNGTVQRTCCADNKGVCRRCWVLLACAAELLRHLLTEQLGLQHLMFVFSGKKGIHVWVLDEETHLWSEAQRKTIVQWIETYDFEKDAAADKLLASYAQKLEQDSAWLSRPLSLEERKALLRLRIDKNVTQQVKHPLKLPFSIHPDTLKPTLVYPFQELLTLNPEAVPTLHDLGTDAFNKGMTQSIVWAESVLEQSKSN